MRTEPKVASSNGPATVWGVKVFRAVLLKCEGYGCRVGLGVEVQISGLVNSVLSLTSYAIQ
eukprot:5774690-Amphidinium_carterae.3